MSLTISRPQPSSVPSQLPTSCWTYCLWRFLRRQSRHLTHRHRYHHHRLHSTFHACINSTSPSLTRPSEKTLRTTEQKHRLQCNNQEFKQPQLRLKLVLANNSLNSLPRLHLQLMYRLRFNNLCKLVLRFSLLNKKLLKPGPRHWPKQRLITLKPRPLQQLKRIPPIPSFRMAFLSHNSWSNTLVYSHPMWNLSHRKIVSCCLNGHN